MTKTYTDKRKYTVEKYDSTKDYDFIKPYFNREGDFVKAAGTIGEQIFPVTEDCYVVTIETFVKDAKPQVMILDNGDFLDNFEECTEDAEEEPYVDIVTAELNDDYQRGEDKPPPDE